MSVRVSHMSGDSGGALDGTYFSWPMRIAGWLLLTLAAVIAVGFALTPGGHGKVPLIALVLAVGGYAWVRLIRPRLVIAGTHLTVVNPLRTYQLELRDVQTARMARVYWPAYGNELRLGTTHGPWVRVVAANESLSASYGLTGGSRISRFAALATNLADVRDGRPPSAPIGGEPRVSRWRRGGTGR